MKPHRRLCPLENVGGRGHGLQGPRDVVEQREGMRGFDGLM